MENDGFFSWQSNSHSTAAAASASASAVKMNNNNHNNNNNCVDESQSASMVMATSCFLNLNWDQSSTDQVEASNFESALSSLVSSPTSSNPTPNLPSSCAADSIVIRELIGRLGSICNNNSNSSSSCMGNGGEEISPSTNNSQCYHSTNTSSSCYSTPLNSPTKLNLAMIQDHHHPQFQFPHHHHHPIPFAAADPGFAERAARFSCFGAARGSNNNAQFAQPPLQEPGKLSRVSSSQSLKAMTTGATAGIQMGGQLGNHDIMAMMMMSSSSSGGEFVNNNAQQQQQQESSGGANSDPIPPSGSDGNVIRKRKATMTSSNSNKGNNNSSGSSRGGGGAGTDASLVDPPPKEDENLTSKRCKSVAEAVANGADKDTAVATTAKVEQGNANIGSGQGQKQGKNKDKENDNAKPPEPPKQDFIHVRARRGQATDSHSLAERVRREKISERMKFLQDLVPGCNKVTGKAVMLDEIINYVQSLQRQVEFLSMKLATVNPQLDFNANSLLSKDIHQPPRGPMMLPQSSYPLEASCMSTGFSYGNQLPQGHGHPPLQSHMGGNGLDNNPLAATSLRRSLSMQLPPLDGFTDTAASSQSQLGAFWEDDLQSVVQMGLIGQNPEAIFSHSFQGSLPTNHMKIEL